MGKPDISTSDEGTIFRLTPNTQAGKEWVKDNLILEDYQKLGDSVAVEARYIVDIIEGAREDGLLVN